MSERKKEATRAAADCEKDERGKCGLPSSRICPFVSLLLIAGDRTRSDRSLEGEPVVPWSTTDEADGGERMIDDGERRGRKKALSLNRRKRRRLPESKPPPSEPRSGPLMQTHPRRK